MRREGYVQKYECYGREEVKLVDCCEPVCVATIFRTSMIDAGFGLPSTRWPGEVLTGFFVGGASL